MAGIDNPLEEKSPIELLWEIVNLVFGTDFPRYKQSRKREEVKVRHVFWAIAHEQFEYSLQGLASWNRAGDHSVVIHGIKRVRRAQSLTPLRLPVEPDVANAYQQARKIFLEEVTPGLDIINIPKWPTLAYL